MFIIRRHMSRWVAFEWHYFQALLNWWHSPFNSFGAGIYLALWHFLVPICTISTDDFMSCQRFPALGGRKKHTLPASIILDRTVVNKLTGTALLQNIYLKLVTLRQKIVFSKIFVFAQPLHFSRTEVISSCAFAVNYTVSVSRSICLKGPVWPVQN
jgi:hypothetical protein